MTLRRFKHEDGLYALAFVLALAVRLVGLGFVPLTDVEAEPALQALRLSQGAHPALSAHPLYILSTSLIFLMFGGGTNFLARLIPALVGSLLVLTPRLFADRLHPRPSLILAFFLALDPGLTAVSRQVASPILAITFFAWTFGLLNQRRFRWAAVAAAFAFLSGPNLWQGVIGVGVAYGISTLLFKRVKSADEKPFFSAEMTQYSNLLIFAAVLLLGGTFFFAVPAGIGAAFSSIPTYFMDWFLRPESAPSWTIPFSLIIYQPFVLLMALIVIVRGSLDGSRRIVFLALWFVLALIFAAVLPKPQIADLTWALLPLSALAALEFERYLDVDPEERNEALGATALVVVLWIFFWLALASVNWQAVDSQDFTLRIAMLFGSIALILISLVLIGMGWSIRVASLGGVWGMALCLGALAIGGLFGSAGLRGLDAPELWELPNVPTQAQLIRDTVSEISDIGKGNAHSADVALVNVNSPALEWLLRENPLTNVSALDAATAPDFVITDYEANPALASAYRGQEFVWRREPNWREADALTWLRWATLREMPPMSSDGINDGLILWARVDLFLDGRTQAP
ncbi:MAG: hypothetical protein LC099_08305 [Anaerolineales bacterium]|nr:hypothetical protein [Anaerolineales bacterium]